MKRDDQLLADVERIAAETKRILAELSELQDEVMVLRHRLTERGRDNDERFAYIYRQLGLRVTRLP